MDNQKIISLFETHSLPKSEWTHEAHLICALWYIAKTSTVWDAICVIKDRIISHNKSVGTANTGQKGYHETITVFWALQLSEFYQENTDLSFDTLVQKLLQDERFTDKSYIKKFYDDEVLKSSQARATYIPATKKPS